MLGAPTCSNAAATMGARVGQSEAGLDRKFMEMAIEESRASASEGQTPFGAVVLDSAGNLIGRGHNEARKTRDPTAHGEIVAIRKAWERVGDWHKMTGGTLYTSCEPCLLCSFVISQIGFARVVFAARGSDVPTYRPLLGSDFSEAAKWINAQSDWAHVEVRGEFMRESAVKVLREFRWDGDYADKPK